MRQQTPLINIIIAKKNGSFWSFNNFRAAVFVNTTKPFHTANQFSCFHNLMYISPAGVYLFEFSYGNARTMCKICSRLTIKTPERRHWHSSGVFFVNFELISHIALTFLMFRTAIKSNFLESFAYKISGNNIFS